MTPTDKPANANATPRRSPKGLGRLRGILSVVMGILSTLLAVATVFSAYGGKINPSESLVGAFAALAFPGFLVLSLIVLIINLVWFRRVAILTGVSLLVCIGPILSFCPLNFLRPSVEKIEKSDRKTFKVMTFNVFAFYDITGTDQLSNLGSTTAAYILEQDPDVLLLQESGNPLSSSPRNPVSPDQQSQLLRRYHYYHSKDQTLTVFSKYPLQNVQSTTEDIEGLSVARYVLTVDDREINLFNIHLQSICLTEHDKKIYRNMTEGDAPDEVSEIRHSILAKLAFAFRQRAVQVRALRKELDQVEGNLLLCGDFNDVPGSYASRVIAGSNLTDAYRQSGLGPAITYHDDKLYFRIDQIFFRGEMRSLRTWVGDCPSSDHYPLLSIFELE